MTQVLAMADLPGAATSFVALVRASEQSAGGAAGAMLSQFRRIEVHAMSSELCCPLSAGISNKRHSPSCEAVCKRQPLDRSNPARTAPVHTDASEGTKH